MRTVVQRVKQASVTVNDSVVSEIGQGLLLLLGIEAADTEEDIQKKVLMSKYTPNFDQQFWRYQGLEILGAEYDWR